MPREIQSNTILRVITPDPIGIFIGEAIRQTQIPVPAEPTGRSHAENVTIGLLLESAGRGQVFIGQVCLQRDGARQTCPESILKREPVGEIAPQAWDRALTQSGQEGATGVQGVGHSFIDLVADSGAKRHAAKIRPIADCSVRIEPILGVTD